MRRYSSGDRHSIAASISSIRLMFGVYHSQKFRPPPPLSVPKPPLHRGWNWRPIPITLLTGLPAKGDGPVRGEQR
jgi:hypothetical protein